MTTTLESVAILVTVVLLQSHVKLDVSLTLSGVTGPPNTAGSCTKAFSVSVLQTLGSALLDEAIRGQKGNSGITLKTTWRRFGPIRTEELDGKWITVQTDRSRQPPGLVSWRWLNTV